MTQAATTKDEHVPSPMEQTLLDSVIDQLDKGITSTAKPEKIEALVTALVMIGRASWEEFLYCHTTAKQLLTKGDSLSQKQILKSILGE